MDDNENESLSLYIRYDGFLSVSQLRETLTQLDRMYNALYAGLTHRDVVDIELQNRMRVDQITTGNSITIELLEGISAFLQSGSPTIQIPAAIGIMSLAARLLLNSVKGVAELRKTWYEGSKAKYEAELAQRKARPNVEVSDEMLKTLPAEAKRIATDATNQIVNLFEYAPNITEVHINGQVLIDKRDIDSEN